jgi:transposase
MAYSIDFIKRAVAYKEEGHTFEELREAFCIPAITYYQWSKRLQDGYYDRPKLKQVRSGKIDKEALKKAVAANPDAYLWELAEQFNCSPPGIFYALENLGITLKKRPLPITKNQKRNALSS